MNLVDGQRCPKYFAPSLLHLMLPLTAIKSTQFCINSHVYIFLNITSNYYGLKLPMHTSTTLQQVNINNYA
jgi:hypothetical protein